MALRMTCARWQELEDEQILALRTELRSYRLNGSGMNKIVRNASATPSSIKRRNVHVQTCNRCDGLDAGLQPAEDLQGARVIGRYYSGWHSIKSRAKMLVGFWHAPRPQQ